MSLGSACPGARIFREVRPEYLKCPGCGHEVEIWSDELLARCLQCGRVVLRERGASCIDWCSHAAECIGAEKLRRLRGHQEPGPSSAKAPRREGDAKAG